MRSSTRIGVVVAALGCLPFGNGCSERAEIAPEAASFGPTGCAVRGEHSRWVGFDALALDAEWQSSGSSIDIRGIGATASGEVFILDGLGRRVVVLDPMLDPIRELAGRNGPLATSNLRGDHWLAVADTFVDLFDGEHVHRYGTAGAYHGVRGAEPGAEPSFPAPNLMALATIDTLTLYALDQRDTNTGERSVVTGLMQRGGTSALIEMPMPPMPGVDGHYTMGTNYNQAQPLWAASDGCVYVSDGASPWLIRYIPGTGAIDTIRLPSVEPPAETDLDREYRRSRIARARVLSRALPDSLDPTAPIRWSRITIDPDGWVWVEPWRPISSRAIPFRAVVVNPETAYADGPMIPEFPLAFGGGGALYVVGQSAATLAPVVRRYAPAPLPAESTDSTRGAGGV